MGHSFRSEDNNDSLALWEEAEHPASIDQGWAELTRPSPRWLEAMRKFDTTKLAPWRSSPVHPKASSDYAHRLSLSDRKGSMKSFHQSAKAPWYSNATAKMGKGESRSVRSPLGACNLSLQSGELITWSGNLLIPPAKSGEFHRSEDSNSGNSSKKSGKQFVATFGNISSKLEHAEEECLASGARSEIPTKDSNIVQTAGALEDGSHTGNALQLQTTAKNTEALTDRKAASRDFSSAKAMDSSTCEADALSDKTSAVQENQDEPSALTPINGNAVISFKQRNELEAGGNSETLVTAQRCLSLAIPSSEQDDDPSPYEALRKRYILKAESEPVDGSLYVFQLRTPAQSVINKEEEAGMSLQSCLLNSRSSSDGGEGHSNQVQASSTSDRMFVSLQNKGPQGMKKILGDFLESSSPRSILCGLADEGSLPSSNPSLRSSTSSALPTSASESCSSSDTSSDFNEQDFDVFRSADNLNAPKLVDSRHVSLSFRDSGPSRPSLENAASATAAVKKANLNTELLGWEDDGELRSSVERKPTTELWTAKFPTLLQESSSQVDAPTELEAAIPPSNNQPATDVKQSESEDLQMSSVVLTSRPRHDGSTTARLGGMFSPLRLTSKCEDGVASNYRNCFVASRTLSFSPHDYNLAIGNRSPTHDSTLELLTMEFQERKSKSKWQFSNRRQSSADSSDAPTMMISINKAMKKIMSKCTAKRSKPPTARGS